LFAPQNHDHGLLLSRCNQPFQLPAGLINVCSELRQGDSFPHLNFGAARILGELTFLLTAVTTGLTDIGIGRRLHPFWNSLQNALTAPQSWSVS
jgi:hypothetical protein